MNAATARKWLLVGLLVVLPLERIPSVHIEVPWELTLRLPQLFGLLLIFASLPLLRRFQRSVLVYLLPLGLFAGSSLASALMSVDIRHSLLIWCYTAFVIMLALAVAATVAESRHYRPYLIALIVAALIACVVGLYQFFGDLYGLPTSATGLRERYTKALFKFPRIQSTALEPLYFANFLLLPTALLFARIAYVRRHVPAMCTAALLMTTCIWLSVSRGAIGALIAMTLVFVALAFAGKRYLAAGLAFSLTTTGGMIAAGLIYVSPSLIPQARPSAPTADAITNFQKQTVNLDQGESAIGRSETRSLALAAWRQRPFFGLGPGGFGRFARTAAPERYIDNRAIVNNEPLELLAETGIIGTTFLGLFVLGLIYAALKRTGNIILPDLRAWIIGLLLALLAIGIQYQTFSTLYIIHIWCAVGLLLGLSVFKQRQEQAA